MLLKGLFLGLVAAGILAVVAFCRWHALLSATQTPQVVEIQALENGQAYVFSQTELRVKPGAVTVRFSNAATSGRPHTFDVKTKDGSGDIVRSDRVDPGKSLDVTFNVHGGGQLPVHLSAARPRRPRTKGHADRRRGARGAGSRRRHDPDVHWRR